MKEGVFSAVTPFLLPMYGWEGRTELEQPGKTPPGEEQF